MTVLTDTISYVVRVCVSDEGGFFYAYWGPFGYEDLDLFYDELTLIYADRKYTHETWVLQKR